MRCAKLAGFRRHVRGRNDEQPVTVLIRQKRLQFEQKFVLRHGFERRIATVGHADAAGAPDVPVHIEFEVAGAGNSRQQIRQRFGCAAIHLRWAIFSFVDHPLCELGQNRIRRNPRGQPVNVRKFGGMIQMKRLITVRRNGLRLKGRIASAA